MSTNRFHKTISGTDTLTIHEATLANTINSSSLVLDEEQDSFYFRALEKQGILLNIAQIQAVRHLKGPLLTLAGAGSGKTSVLVARTGYLLTVHHVHPRNILLVTFTKKAAQEMKERIARLPGVTRQAASNIQTSTFHSFFLKLIRSRGFDQEILTSERFKHIILKKILKELGLSDTYQPETLLTLFSSYKMNLVSFNEIPSSTSVEKEIKQIYTQYEQWKKEKHQMDFDDILLEAYHLLLNSPDLVVALQNRFTYIMIDEFQDTNFLQYELFKMIARSHQNLMVVGDDDQTIYSFNGARNEFILQFDKEFPTAKTVTLDINYRSTSTIVGLGNAIIAMNQQRKPKTLQSTRTSNQPPMFATPASVDEEATWVIQDIQEKVASGDHTYKDFAVLHRTATNSRAMFEELTKADIPFINYSVTDQTFYEQWPVREVVCHLKLALYPNEYDAIADMLATLYINKDVGMNHIMISENVTSQPSPLLHLTSMPSIKEYQKNKVVERVQLLKQIRTIEPYAAIKMIRDRFYDKYLEANERQTVTNHKEALKETLDELETSAKRFSSLATFIAFIEEIIEKNRDMMKLKKDSETNAISLMTIHRSKGLEFPVVYLIGASEGILPHVSAIDADKLKDLHPGVELKKKKNLAVEEERRLCYVAITRAKEELFISSPTHYRGKHVDVSRFLREASPIQKQEKNNSKEIEPIPRKFKETIVAWKCSSSSCIAWMRILTHENPTKDQKKCPLCRASMETGKVDIYE
ncbi:UvrD-helicase domain-containing protein [Bacillus alkalicellulosilyticus]|uniref:UvrD-helicase domain-containing protein n=1 Tax=Alkalihalobacterium alkalicellulosilyticum TaxID=1912214 RepID=UPI00099702CD|nr:UvrD-helicase domain-containing protein [Bacillus alkalicellulosilyticus]